jgi:hypothetical protein
MARANGASRSMRAAAALGAARSHPAGVPAIGEVYLARGRAYELFVIFHDTSNERDANRFFRSLRIEP